MNAFLISVTAKIEIENTFSMLINDADTLNTWKMRIFPKLPIIRNRKRGIYKNTAGLKLNADFENQLSRK